MRSFLQGIEDNGLTWEDDVDDGDSSSSSVTSTDSSEEDELDQDVIDDPEQEHGNDELLVDIREEQAQEQDQEVAPAVDEPAVDEDPEPEAPVVRADVQDIDVVAAVMENLRSHPRSENILFRVARSEELALVRPDINWSLLASELPSYPAEEVGDSFASVLLQGILRMDPPIEVLRQVLKAYPKSCVNMDSFFVACQHSSDEVVQLVMRRTMQARRSEGIKWGMLAFLGDARIRTKHARFLLQSVPEAVTDPGHGVFGVSPLDRMLSGAFIHGHPAEWIAKVKLALLTAEFGSVDATAATDESFFPIHALIRRIASSDFMGVHFGAFTFVRTLVACLRAEEEEQPFHGVNNNGDLPLHIALGRECKTNLGVLGERKLIRFLLRHNPQAAVMPNSEGLVPLRLSIENGWPCYDVIVDAFSEALRTRDTNGDLCIHAALKGTYHERFGISGARDIVKFLLNKNPRSALTPDGRGRLPLHLALENGWPCHDILLAAAPNALETRDVTSGFYPFQIAAYSFRESEDEQSLRGLSQLYELVREAPLLSYGLASDLDDSSATENATRDTSSEKDSSHDDSATRTDSKGGTGGEQIEASRKRKR